MSRTKHKDRVRRPSRRERAIAAQPVDAPRTPIAEQLLGDVIRERAAERVLCTTLSRGQLAETMARCDATRKVTCHFLDMFYAEATRQRYPDQGGPFEIVCSSDFPEAEYDLVAIPVDPQGDAELTRDLMQAAHSLLKIGGTLATAVKNSHDSWLHGEMQALCSKVTRQAFTEGPGRTHGVVYVGTKTAPLKKLKNFTCEFAFRDGERLINAISRPGVFSHRRLDPGARALLNTMHIQPGARILDIGCGSGGVSLGAAFRAPGVQIVALDSYTRAVECTARGAALNGLDNIRTVLAADGRVDPAAFDVALGNPPYFSEFRIAEVFLQTALRGLRQGGEVQMVTKTPNWFEKRMRELFDDVEVQSHKMYHVVRGRQK